MKYQEFSSAGTSINVAKLPSVFNKVLKSKNVEWVRGGKNFDIGGGRFDNMTAALKEQEVDNHIYDPFNRDADFNADSIVQAAHGQSDTATISNVLNIIKEPENQLKAIKQAHNALKEDGKVFITVYEGNPKFLPGPPPNKPNQFQHNKKLTEYLPLVKEVFSDAEIKNGMIIGTKKGSIPKTSPTYVKPKRSEPQKDPAVKLEENIKERIQLDDVEVTAEVKPQPSEVLAVEPVEPTPIKPVQDLTKDAIVMENQFL